jgi:serine/threonine protein kinase
VKKIKCSAETDEEIRREVALLASLGGHRNIVRCFGGQLVAPGGFFWIVMEHMECGTLADIMGLTGEALSEGEAAAVLRDVCSGLGYLHNLGFIHKDIKVTMRSLFYYLSNLCYQPHNILMGARAIAKLADFGVSQKAPEADASEETPGRNAGGGTLAFMGPEVVRGQVCAKSDVWALGVTAIHLLTNVSPHEGLSDLQLAEAIVSGPPLRLPEGGRKLSLLFFWLIPTAGFSKEAQAAVESCLQPDLQERGSLNHVARLAFVAYAAPREKSLMPLVQRVLAIKEEREREEETARRRALVGGGKKPPVARE